MGLAIDREARKMSGATGAKRKLSGAQMPEQRRAGQLVYHISDRHVPYNR